MTVSLAKAPVGLTSSCYIDCHLKTDDISHSIWSNLFHAETVGEVPIYASDVWAGTGVIPTRSIDTRVRQFNYEMEYLAEHVAIVHLDSAEIWEDEPADCTAMEAITRLLANRMGYRTHAVTGVLFGYYVLVTW